jgi:hypothetical protein
MRPDGVTRVINWAGQYNYQTAQTKRDWLLSKPVIAKLVFEILITITHITWGDIRWFCTFDALHDDFQSSTKVLLSKNNNNTTTIRKTGPVT